MRWHNSIIAVKASTNRIGPEVFGRVLMSAVVGQIDGFRCVKWVTPTEVPGGIIEFRSLFA